MPLASLLPQSRKQGVRSAGPLQEIIKCQEFINVELIHHEAHVSAGVSNVLEVLLMKAAHHNRGLAFSLDARIALCDNLIVSFDEVLPLCRLKHCLCDFRSRLSLHRGNGLRWSLYLNQLVRLVRVANKKIRLELCLSNR